MKGVVIKSTGSWYDIQDERGRYLKCRLKGIFRVDESRGKDSNPVAVGDRVVLEKGIDNDAWTIAKVEKRENYIVRTSPKHKGARHVIAANIDQALLLITVAYPRTSTGFIDRFLITAEAYHIPTILVFNKQDLLTGKTKRKQEEMIQTYSQVGYPIQLVSTLTGQGLAELKQSVQYKTSLVAGHSGVGKSSLMNALQPGLNLRTNALSKVTEKGMHTTTFAEMHPLDFGGYVIDTPGIREFGILDFKPEEISHYFVEFRGWLPQCKFNNCLHENEPGCAVKEACLAGQIAVKRYESYLNIMQDYKANYKHWE